jgi:GNAT superfamily N-acetyltransferase
MGGPVRRASRDDHAALAPLWESAARDLGTHRGGPVLLASLVGGRPEADVLADALADDQVWCALAGDDVIGFAWRLGEVIAGLYVAPGYRRRGYGRALVTALLDESPTPRDGFALPGDRATKSLYESIGWKARLLTMRAD